MNVSLGTSSYSIIPSGGFQKKKRNLRHWSFDCQESPCSLKEKDLPKVASGHRRSTLSPTRRGLSLQSASISSPREKKERLPRPVVVLRMRWDEINLRCTEVEWVSKAPKLHDVNKRHLSKELGTLLIYLHRGFPENIIMILWFARQTVSNTADCKLLDYRALSYSSLMPGLISVPEPAPGHDKKSGCNSGWE
ncbi:uncharacterized protein [Callorhinus ursinus]|uniref:uncharacterized protein isoform X2 n=1 Tax=Callorhinus ursinus TaxID=34884 RepID=UPI003CD02C90